MGAIIRPRAGNVNLLMTSLVINGVDWSGAALWKSSFDLQWRKGLGVVAEISLDVTGATPPAPTDTFVFSLPTGEKFVLKPVNVGEVPTYGRGAEETVAVKKYTLIDFLSALDREPLPEQEYFDSNSGEIARGILSAMNPAIDTSGIEDGNPVAYLNTRDFAKLSDIVRQQEFAEGGYIIQIDPLTNNGLAVVGKYAEDFGASGVIVDKDIDGLFTPPKEPIVPDEQIINYQRVKGRPEGGPRHTVCEARELDALNPSFKLAAVPFGLEASQVLDFQFDGGTLTGQETDSLPKVVPLHYPVAYEVSDISMLGTGEICSLIGRSGTVLLSTIVGSSSIGVRVNGTAHTLPTPFVAGGAAEDADHQYYYDVYAKFLASGLEVRITEHYLDNTAGETELATVSAINDNVITLSLPAGRTTADLPKSIRFFAPGDPNDLRGFATIQARDAATITIDPVPANLAIGDSLATGDSTSVTITEKVVYSGPGPATRFGKPQLIVSGGTGIRARGWSMSYGPPVEMRLLDNPYTGEPGRLLKVDAANSRSSDVVVSRSGNGAVATFVGDRVPLTGVLRLIINYDAARQADVVVENLASQAVFGIRQGDIIESDYAITEAEAQAIGQAVVDEFGFPSPRGTIVRESYFTDRCPRPNETVAIDVPEVYEIEDEATPISEVHITYKGVYHEGSTRFPVFNYQITLGALDLIEEVERDLLSNQVSAAARYRELMASGPRISSFTWNDTDTVSLGISGGAITLAGKTAAATFNPADFAVGNLREAPVTLEGTISEGGKVHRQRRALHKTAAVSA